MYLAIIILPLLGSIASGFFGRKIGVSGAQLITCITVVTTTVLAVLAFFEVGLNNIPVSIHVFRWIDSESLNVSWGFHFDSLTVSMLIPVLIVSSLVHIYSIGYMSHDPHNQRFFSYLSLFTFMMIILVTANNFLLMFVGWEGVGVCSYLLVCFWFTRIAANQSSLSAFLTNRVGDCFLTIGMFAILSSFGNLDYATVFSLAPYMNENVITVIGICLLIGAMAKSSQVGLHVWLPMAMEGPTPVSALIHAATMVTAGVYLLMRSSPLIEYSSTVLMLCLWLGAITTVFSSLIGLFQQDIKKVIAYSTMSQLGMMVIAVGLSCYNIALFHLINHAFYKGLLFLGAGAVIHAVADNQDFRRYGGLRPFLPLTYSVMLIASLSLVAFPFMTGFYSKDFILESAYGQYYFSSTVVYIIATIGAMFTTLYSVKVLYLTFLTNPNGPLINYKQAHEGDIFMSLPLIILAIFSIFFGFITKDIFIGLGSGFFADNALFIHPSHEIMLDTEFGVPTIFKLLPLVFTILLSVISIVLSEYLSTILIYFKYSRIGYNVFSFFNQRFLIELYYNKYITNFILKLGGQTTKVIDKGSIELLGPYGLEKGLLNLSNNIAKLNTGIITSYALYILVGLIFYLLCNAYITNTISILVFFTSLVLLLYRENNYFMHFKSSFCFTPSQLFSKWALHSHPKPHTFTSLPLQSAGPGFGSSFSGSGGSGGYKGKGKAKATEDDFNVYFFSNLDKTERKDKSQIEHDEVVALGIQEYEDLKLKFKCLEKEYQELAVKHNEIKIKHEEELDRPNNDSSLEEKNKHEKFCNSLAEETKTIREEYEDKKNEATHIKELMKKNPYYSESESELEPASSEEEQGGPSKRSKIWSSDSGNDTDISKAYIEDNYPYRSVFDLYETRLLIDWSFWISKIDWYPFLNAAFLAIFYYIAFYGITRSFIHQNLVKRRDIKGLIKVIGFTFTDPSWSLILIFKSKNKIVFYDKIKIVHGKFFNICGLKVKRVIFTSDLFVLFSIWLLLLVYFLNCDIPRA
jgi:NADH-ubiquinone oxidoreductase chain 5